MEEKKRASQEPLEIEIDEEERKRQEQERKDAAPKSVMRYAINRLDIDM